MQYIFLKNSTKEKRTVITRGLILVIDFLKNLKNFTCALKITPVLNNFVKLVDKFNNEKNNCL